MNAIHRLLKPRSVAVIGASADPRKTAGRPVSYLLKHGFGGAVYPVNPKVGEIGGLKCYPDIASLPETPDVGIVLLGAERAHLAVRSGQYAGARFAVAAEQPKMIGLAHAASPAAPNSRQASP